MFWRYYMSSTVPLPTHHSYHQNQEGLHAHQRHHPPAQNVCTTGETEAVTPRHPHSGRIVPGVVHRLGGMEDEELSTCQTKIRLLWQASFLGEFTKVGATDSSSAWQQRVHEFSIR